MKIKIFSGTDKIQVTYAVNAFADTVNAQSIESSTHPLNTPGRVQTWYTIVVVYREKASMVRIGDGVYDLARLVEEALTSTELEPPIQAAHDAGRKTEAVKLMARQEAADNTIAAIMTAMVMQGMVDFGIPEALRKEIIKDYAGTNMDHDSLWGQINALAALEVS